MLENSNQISSQPGVDLYVRWVKPQKNLLGKPRAVILLNSRSLCVESSMGISMGTISYADYCAGQGLHSFLVDLRGYGRSTVIQEQLVESYSQVTNPTDMQDYHTDLVAVCRWIRELLGPSTEITLVGFSFLATVSVVFADQYPDLVDKVLVLNPNWLDSNLDPPRPAAKFVSATDPDCPYVTVDMPAINTRFTSAQLPGKNFIEPLWYDQAFGALKEYHRSFNVENNSWRLLKLKNWYNYMKNAGNMSRIRADVVVLHSQYDSENPFHIVNRLFTRISTKNKYLFVLPNATHLCIWERARHDLYARTTEFSLL